MAGAAPKRPLRPSYVFHVRLTLLQQQKVRPYFVNCSTNWIVFSASLTQGPRRPNETSLLRPCAIVFSRSEEHTSELQSLLRISYTVFCFTKKKQYNI